MSMTEDKRDVQKEGSTQKEIFIELLIQRVKDEKTQEA